MRTCNISCAAIISSGLSYITTALGGCPNPTEFGWYFLRVLTSQLSVVLLWLLVGSCTR